MRVAARGRVIVLLACLTAGGALMTGSALAQSPGDGAAPREWPSRRHSWQPQNPPCTCRAQGREFLVGERICMMTQRGARQAVCGMVMNNTSWDVVEESCENS